MGQAEQLFGAQRVDIVHGFIAEDCAVDALFDRRRARWLSKRPPTRAEVAAYASHRLAWQRLLQGSHEAALILEDDFQVCDPQVVRRAIAASGELLSGGRHLIKLFDFPRQRGRDRSIRCSVAGLDLIKWERTRAGLVGYLISREGAARLLARNRVFRVVDEDIKFFWELGLDIWSIPGNPVVDASHEIGGSLLEGGRQASRRRSVRRSLHGLLLNLHRDVMTRWHYLGARMRMAGNCPARSRQADVARRPV